MQATVQPYAAKQHGRVLLFANHDILYSTSVTYMAEKTSKPLKIQSRTKSDEVRKSVGFTRGGWQVFLVCTACHDI